MTMETKSFEDLIKRTEKLVSEGLRTEAERFAVIKLSDRKSIANFVSKYIEMIKDKIDNDSSFRNKTIERLLKTGYSTEDLAQFLAFDGLYFTLGHFFEEKNLPIWYKTLEEVWSDRDMRKFRKIYKAFDEDYMNN